MATLHTLKNDYLQITVNQTGAELSSIRLLSNNTDYLWDANPDIWASHSPVLFPIIGNLKEGSYFLDGKRYSLPKHGFVRNNPEVQLSASTANSLTFRLASSAKTLEQYPFDFEFLISYTLRENEIVVSHEIANADPGDLYFSLGAHPAFRCPIQPEECYEDYHLEFELAETACTYPIEASGLMGEKADLILNNTRILQLHRHLFDQDALVFKDLRSRSVSLCSKKTGKRVQVDFSGFPYLGIWAKPNADFVCIEPWMGIADSTDTDQRFETKEGILKLPASRRFTAEYSIKIFLWDFRIPAKT